MKGRQIPYSAEEREFIHSVSQWPRSEAHASFCQKFRRDDVTLKNFNALCKRNGWLTGRTGCFVAGQAPLNKGKPHPARGRSAETQFRKGNVPSNVKPLWSERVGKDGYIEMKVPLINPHTGHQTRFMHKHRYLWEQANGALPKGQALKCLDGDRRNTDPTNWIAVNRGMLPRLVGGNRHHDLIAYDEAPIELKPLILATAELDHRARMMRRGKHSEAA